MTSKRRLQNKLADLKAQGSDEEPPLILTMTHIEPSDGAAWPERSDSPHPELTVQPFPEEKPQSLTIATPNHLPEQYYTANMVIVVTCEYADRHGADLENDNTVTACELWDSLTDDDLRREYDIRQERGEQIPPLLEEYGPEE